MKTQNQTMVLEIEKEVSTTIQQAEKNSHQHDFIKTSFCTANLWNIQKNRRTGITYRKYL